MTREQAVERLVDVGDRFGAWTVLELLPRYKSRARCDCGNESVLGRGPLSEGRSTRCRPCGDKARMRDVSEMVGKSYGDWTVVAVIRRVRRPATLTVRCVCGSESEASVRSLEIGRSTRCLGCAATRHGGSYTREYAAWKNMIGRCTNSNDSNWKHYGARGIRVCDEWQGGGGFERFLAHVGDRPSPRHSIDRIDNDGNYEPGNVRWATAKEQRANQRPRHAVLEQVKR